jgi:alkanesulfonate monooxygenase SsuD/methylene tetrahydromethanopterin reductase-like flavin-dependent oxidoreductase (luciferase family)
VGTPDDLAERIARGIEAGADYVILYVPGLAYDLDPLHLLEEGVVSRLGGAATTAGA